MNLITLLIVLLILVMLFGGVGYRAGWYPAGPPYYGPSLLGLLVGIILIVLVLRLLGLF
jgi:hypothetical protein